MQGKDLDKALGIIKKEMKRIASDGYKEWVLSVFNECDSSIK